VGNRYQDIDRKVEITRCVMTHRDSREDESELPFALADLRSDPRHFARITACAFVRPARTHTCVSYVTSWRLEARFRVEMARAVVKARQTRKKRKRKERGTICRQRYREIPRQCAAKSRENPRKFISAATIRSHCPRAFHSRTGHSALISSLLAKNARSFLILVDDKSETSRITHAHTHARMDTDTPQGGNKRFVAAARQEPP